MSETISAQFLIAKDGDIETKKYLDSLSMIGLYGTDDNPALLYVELRDMPNILKHLERKNYLKDYSSTWEIIKLSSEGLTLYMSNSSADAYVFIPKEQIICIHTVSSYFLDGIGDKT